MLITMWITIGRVWGKEFGGKYVGDIIVIPIQVLPPGRFTFDVDNFVDKLITINTMLITMLIC